MVARRAGQALRVAPDPMARVVSWSTTETWIMDAECVGQHFASDYAYGSKMGAQVFTEIFCHHCDVISECADFAEKNGEVVGVWGGVDLTLKYARRESSRRAQANGRTAERIPPVTEDSQR